MNSTHYLSIDALHQKAKSIELLILDVDGVLTNGKIYLSSNGDEMLAFHIHDGHGIKLLQQIGVTIAVISGRDNMATRMRLTNLGIQHIYLGEKDKAHRYALLKQALNIDGTRSAYIGDDLPDLPVMQQVTLPIAVKNAVPQVKQVALWETTKSGGKGAVREVCDIIYAAKIIDERSES